MKVEDLTLLDLRTSCECAHLTSACINLPVSGLLESLVEVCSQSLRLFSQTNQQGHEMRATTLHCRREESALLGPKALVSHPNSEVIQGLVALQDLRGFRAFFLYSQRKADERAEFQSSWGVGWGSDISGYFLPHHHKRKIPPYPSMMPKSTSHGEVLETLI